MRAVRRDGRVVECTGLENRQGFVAPLGFKSLSLHHFLEKPPHGRFFAIWRLVMSVSESSHPYKRIVKHALLWCIFAYFYHSGINVLVAMAHDAQPDYGLLSSIAYGIGFNVLVGHLIGKYDKYWPTIAACVIATLGLLVVPLFVLGRDGLLSSFFIVSMIVTLPLTTFIIDKIKLRISANTEQTQ